MQIEVFECDGNNKDNINGWLKANPNIEIINIFYAPMYDLYSYGAPQICNQWIITTVVYKEVK